MLDARDFARWSLLGGMIATFIALRWTGLSVDYKGIGYQLPLLIVSALICGQVYRPYGNVMVDRTVYGLECFGLFLATVTVSTIATYPMAALSSGWIDSYLIAGDRVIGLDWLAYWHFVKYNPVIYLVLDRAYLTLFSTPLILIISMVWMGKINHCYRFVSAFIIALVITDIASVFFPAHSAEAYFLGSHADLPQAGLAHIPVIEGLRNGSIRVVQLWKIQGLIAFPSFHAAACIMFLWFSWPVRFFRAPSIVANGLMMLSTPLQGGHYFSDILAGVAVGLAAVVACERLFAEASDPSAPLVIKETAKRPDRRGVLDLVRPLLVR